MQNHHSLIYREEEREMFPLLKVIQLRSNPSKHLSFPIVFGRWSHSLVAACSWSSDATYGCRDYSRLHWLVRNQKIHLHWWLNYAWITCLLQVYWKVCCRIGHRRDHKTVRSSQHVAQALTHRLLDLIAPRVEQVANKKKISMAQVAIAWSLAKEGNILPLGFALVLRWDGFIIGVSASIVGTTSLRNLEDIIAGIHVVLDAEEIKLLEEPYKPTAVIGHF